MLEPWSSGYPFPQPPCTLSYPVGEETEEEEELQSFLSVEDEGGGAGGGSIVSCGRRPMVGRRRGGDEDEDDPDIMVVVDDEVGGTIGRGFVGAGGAPVGKLSCPRCARQYSVNYTLERHLRYECGVAKQFACPACPKTFRRRYVLSAHQKKAGHFGPAAPLPYRRHPLPPPRPPTHTIQ
ncbi:hypothetical protein J437_LFUL013606 [Ladona fulva]|uniref:C2H2-type domain-containing protein n=1 Tax=Ladona fulva TaxID=123851 RepID=A0A8K0P2Q3_LADFU|nr:hypothetical protein J437_LFUL013606 [Ladona fulva]